MVEMVTAEVVFRRRAAKYGVEVPAAGLHFYAVEDLGIGTHVPTNEEAKTVVFAETVDDVSTTVSVPVGNEGLRTRTYVQARTLLHPDGRVENTTRSSAELFDPAGRDFCFWCQVVIPPEIGRNGYDCPFCGGN